MERQHYRSVTGERLVQILFQNPIVIYGQSLNQRPDGVFPYPRPPDDWGGGGSPPPAICQITGPILDPKTAFDSSRLEFSEYVAKFCL